MIKYLKILAKSFLYGLVAIFLLLFMFILLLRAPSNQTLLAKYYAPKIEKAIGYPLTLDRIQLKFFDEVSFWGLKVKDPWGKEMIYIHQLDVNFSIYDLLLGQTQPALDYARLVRPKVHLIFEKKSGKMNLEEFIDRLSKWISPGKKDPKAPSSMFFIHEAEVIDGAFALDDFQTVDEGTPTHFDISHFSIQKIHSKVKEFYVKDDTIALQTIGLSGIDPDTKFTVKSLDTKFLISDKQMRFDQLSLWFNDSWLKNKVVMNYANKGSLSSWNTKVNMQANFDNAKILGEDLGRFVSSMNEYKGIYRLKGQLNGTVESLNLKNFELGFGTKSVLKGDFGFKGLPNVKKTLMDFKMKNSFFVPQDLATFISKPAAEKMKILGPSTLDGTFVGTHLNFSTSGKMKTGLGYMEANFDMALKDSMAFSAYKGKVSLKKFRLGVLVDLQDYVGTIDLDANIKGTGFSNRSANIDFDGQISEINLNHYAYKRVALRGNLQKQLFKGAVSVKDSNLLATMIGEINLRNEKPHYQLDGRITRADLVNLNLIQSPLKVNADFKLDMKFNDLDDFEGGIVLTDLLIKKPNVPELSVDLLSFNSDISRKNKKRYKLNSDLVSIDVEGDFLPNQLKSDLLQLWGEYGNYFKKNDAERALFYAQKNAENSDKYHADFTIICHHLSPILARWFPSIDLAKNTVFSGNIMKGRALNLSLEAYPDTLVFGGYKFYQSIFSFQSSKFLGSPEVSSSLVFQSRRQHLNFLTPTENFKLGALWDQDRINFTLDFKQQEEENSAHLGGIWKFEKEGFSLKFKDSYFRILGQDWSIDPLNKLSFLGKELKADHVFISNNKQSISLQGSISKDSTNVLTLKAKKFQLETLKPIFSIKSVGELNAELSIQDWYQHTHIDAWAKIDSFRLGKVYMGNLLGLGTYRAEEKVMDLDFNLNRFGESVLSMSGIYQPFEENEKLNLVADLTKTNLQILEPFTVGVFSDFKGTALGKLHIGGTISQPIVTGKLAVQKAGVTFDYLNTTLAFSDTIEFLPRQIIGKNWLVKDADGNTAKVNTAVSFPLDKPFELSLGAELSKFKILNTQRNPSSIYYGIGYASGLMKIDGTLQNLMISGNLKSEKGTRLFIPLDREEVFSDEEDYEFLSKTIKASTELEKQSLTQKLSDDGIQMNLDLELTPEAYGEVQFDQKKGDLMRVYGQGNVNMTLDKKGKFQMNGEYAIDQGDYTFTLQNVINKKFSIEKNSKISWKGNPLDAQVNIKAIYTQYASLYPILLDTSNKANSPEYKRRYPVDVSINLKNRLLSPDISFNVGIRDYPKDVNFNSSVTAFANRIKTDEQELTRQVSNVLLFGQLVPPYGGSGIELGSLVGNFTEMLSNQLSNLASKINKDLNIDVYLGGGSLNQDLLTNLQLRATYTINDELRVTRSGGFTDARNQTSLQMFLGDWSTEWFIKKDGSFRWKAYTRNVQTTLAGSLNSYQINRTYGSSIIFNKNFNRFFWQKKGE
ncbi:translocation/assembly module TamB domain-containing protein [Aquirufa sp. ROCK-SH2]